MSQLTPCACGNPRYSYENLPVCAACDARTRLPPGKVLAVHLRDKPYTGGVERFLQRATLEDPEVCLTSLLRYELGYGGMPTDLHVVGGRAILTVQTGIMGCIDRVIVEGDEATMAPILVGVRTFLEVANRLQDLACRNAFDVLCNKDLPGSRRGPKGVSPLLATTLGPILVGQSLVRATLAHVYGAALEDLERMDDKDIPAVLNLAVESGRPFRDVAIELGALAG